MKKDFRRNKIWSATKLVYHGRSTKKVRTRSFHFGDQVLAVRRLIIVSHKTGGKFTSKLDGPYVIREVYTNGSYKITNADGVRVGPIKGTFWKRYYH